MILAVLQARTSSSRLPGKVLAPILGEPMLLHQIERLRRCREIDKLVVATSAESSDDAVAAVAENAGIPCYRGSLHDVLDRYYQAARQYRPQWVVRVTGDCPLIDWEVVDACVRLARQGTYDWASNALNRTWPDGLDVECMTFAALETAWREASEPLQREHVTPFIHRDPVRFRLGSLERPGESLAGMRWTVDEPRDLSFVTRVYEALYPVNPAFTSADILKFLTRHPEVAAINVDIERNKAFNAALAKLEGRNQMSTQKPRSFGKSEAMLDRSLRCIPLGTQTFSKSYTQFPRGVSPFFIKRAKGSRAWDVDDNEYLDFANALASVTLGHNDPDVTAAVKAQLEDGTLYSLAHPLEVEVAELICQMVPCAKAVRFGKNGSDATSGAVRAARAFTGRERIAVCGYHGWQDWYIGSTARNKGVPAAVRELTSTFAYNDLNSLETELAAHPGEFAAVILEPMNVAYPQPGFLEGVVAAAHNHGALAVFDETITGFRFANGGAQELFGVTPDLATFGKGLANGYPLSAVAGRPDVMAEFAEIFFSFTMGGEALSLAAAKATLEKLNRDTVCDRLRSTGERVLAGVKERIERHGCGTFLEAVGHPAWSFLIFKDAVGSSLWEIKTLWMQETLARGLLSVGTHNISFAHDEADVVRLLAIYDEVFPLLSAAVADKRIGKYLRCRPLEPLFRIR